MILIMTKKTDRKLIAGHLQGSIVGVIVALTIGLATSDNWSVIDGKAAAESSRSGVSGVSAPPTFPASTSAPGLSPAAAPPKTPARVVPDTVNGELVWPDPWDQISEPTLRFSY